MQPNSIHPIKADLPISFTPSSITTDLSNSQLPNVLLSIFSILPGIVNEVILQIQNILNADNQELTI